MSEEAEGGSTQGRVEKATDPVIPIFDGHNDSLGRLHDAQAPAGTFCDGRQKGHVDLPRARAGGMFGGFYAVFVANPKGAPSGAAEDAADTEEKAKARRSAHAVMTKPGDTPYRVPLPPPLDPQYARLQADGMVQRFEAWRSQQRDDGSAWLRPVLCAADLDAARRERQHAGLLHFEGAEPIEDDCSNLEHYYERGLRSLGPVWSRANAFGTGVPFAFPASPDEGPGLSAAGRELVRRCEDLGILVDLAHLNLAGFRDVARITRRPLVVTHSAVHRLSQKPRNLLDEQIREVGASGGVIGLNFNCADIRADGRWIAQTPLSDYLRHLEALVELAGEGAVALGSDFDGALMPEEMRDASQLQRLIAAMRDQNWSEELIERIAWRNWRRVLQETIG